MKREIKFRAWNKRDKVMGHLLALHYEGGSVVMQKPNSTLYHLPADQAEVMQFTGLHDKNGKEIYEGDIIRCASKRKCPHEIVWLDRVPADNFLGDGMPGWYLSNMNAGYDFVGDEEVIGNIHESPELLNRITNE